MKNCYCGSGLMFENCCAPLICGHNKASSALALMRSRFSAFSIGDIQYLKRTMGTPFPEDKLHPFKWVKLEIIAQPDIYHVEFKAYYLYRDKLYVLHEQSKFSLTPDGWIYMAGKLMDTEKETRLIALNSICPCGSGKKYKNCHQKNC